MFEERTSDEKPPRPKTESRADAAGDSADKPNRRELLGALGALPVVGVASLSASEGKSKQKPDAVTGPTFVTRSDKLEYARLKALDLNDPEVAAEQKKMPVGKIGNLSVGRLISGSNLISMNMHARDLDYVRALAANYNTEERVFMTLKKCEEHGVNTIVLKNHNFKHFRLSRYWDEWGGKMQWLADVITTDINKYERLVVEHLELGASAVYLWGGASDVWYHQKKQGNIVKAFEIMKKYDVPVGICAHRLAPLEFCQREGLVPDFYMKTLHHDRYWSAHPKENREFMEMYSDWSDDHARFHDNLWCDSHEKTVAFMQDVKIPWIAFKVLAAGAIRPEDGFKHAFDGGADFICVGMFDFQVKKDVELTLKTIAQAKDRKRRWA
ncbi:MAG: hypothetical protein ACYTG0_00690 [Planctomycetota bacterium]|jgi:hypothetical protein